MRTPILAAILGGLGLAAGGGYYGLEIYPEQQFRAALDQSIARLPPGVTVTYATAHYSVLSHLATVTGIRLHAARADAAPQPVDAVIDSMEVSNPNLSFSQTWANAQANPSSWGDDTALPIADTIVITGVSIHAATMDMTQASFTVDKARLYPRALLHEGMPTFAAFQAAAIPKSQPPTLADLQPLLRLEAAGMLGIGYDNYDAEGLSLSVNITDVDLTYKVRKMAGTGFDRGVMRGATIEGLTTKSSQFGAFTLDRMVMSAFDIRDPATRLINGESLSVSMLDGITIGRVDYDGITAQAPGKPAMHAGGMSIGPVSFTKGLPVSAAIAFRDFRIEASLLPDARSQDGFSKLGLEQATISFAMAYDWDVAGKRASIHDTSLKVDELGTLSLSADLTNLGTTTNVLSLAQARLGHARLRLEDASLADRLLGLGAAMAGTDEEAFRQQVVATMQQPDTGPELKAAQIAVATFITSPKTLTVELAPPAPVPVMLLAGAAGSPARLAMMLGLKVTANAP